MAQEGNTNHVVSQLDTLSGGPASNQLIKDLEQALESSMILPKVFKVVKMLCDIVLTNRWGFYRAQALRKMAAPENLRQRGERSLFLLSFSMILLRLLHLQSFH
jgi:hypothetical protein